MEKKFRQETTVSAKCKKNKSSKAIDSQHIKSLPPTNPRPKTLVEENNTMKNDPFSNSIFFPPPSPLLRQKLTAPPTPRTRARLLPPLTPKVNRMKFAVPPSPPPRLKFGTPSSPQTVWKYGNRIMGTMPNSPQTRAKFTSTANIQLWEQVWGASARENHLYYKDGLQDGTPDKIVELDDDSPVYDNMYEPAAFKSLFDISQKMVEQDGLAAVRVPKPDGIITRGML